jgi:uncharacterized protein
MISIPQFVDYFALLRDAQTIAVVGLSPKENRPSNMVARYLIAAGFHVFPVNPGHTAILGRHCYASLLEIPDNIDIVDIFRNSADVLPIVEDAVRIGAKTIWMQQGIVNEEAAELARCQGLAVVIDRCIKIEHQNGISSVA